MANDRTNMVSLLDFGKYMGGTTSNILELGDGYTELTEDWSPNIEEKQYVNQKTASNTLNGYALSMTPERDHLSDEAQQYIDDAFRKFPTGTNAQTDYFRYYKTDKVGENSFKCIKVPVIVAPSSTGGAGGETLVSSIQISGNGDVVEGVITVTEDGYTFTEGAADGTQTVAARTTAKKSESSLS
ncbi:MAG: hypothetical protein NC548_34945 [Lachnospiraceae bacterium]|nr:hypothetical protein [Lachnospiraceae bacterium]